MINLMKTSVIFIILLFCYSYKSMGNNVGLTYFYSEYYLQGDDKDIIPKNNIMIIDDKREIKKGNINMFIKNSKINTNTKFNNRYNVRKR